MKERKTELSVMNVFFCLLVIFIHTSSAPVIQLAKTTWQSAAVFMAWKLASFVVYGFLFIGGVRFALHPPEPGIKGTFLFYRKKLFRILIPYIIWVVVYYLWLILFMNYRSSFGQLLKFLLTGTAASHFYFVLIILQLFILAPVFRRLKPSRAAAVLPILFLITLICESSLPELLGKITPALKSDFLGLGEFRNDRVFTSYLFYWAAGVYAGFAYDKVRDAVSKSRIPITVFWLLTAGAELFFEYRLFAYEEMYSDWNGLYTPLHHLFICASILFAFTWALKIKDLCFFKTGFFRLQDRCSFSVYLFHLLVMNTFDRIAGELWDLSILPAYLLRMAVTFTVTFACCMSVAFFSGKIRKKLSENE